MNRNFKINLFFTGIFLITRFSNAQTDLNSNLLIQSNQFLLQSYKYESKIIPYLGETSILLNTGHVNSWYSDYQMNIGQTISNPIQSLRLNSFKSQELKTKFIEVEFANAQLQKQWILNSLEYSFLFQQISAIQRLFTAIELADSALIKRVSLGLNSNADRLTINLLKGKLVLEIQKLNSSLIHVKSNLLLLKPDLDEFPDSSLLFNLNINYGVGAELKQRISIQENRIKSIQSLQKFEQSRILPKIQLGFTQQSFKGYQTINSKEVFFNNDKAFHSMQIGLSAPLITNGYQRNKKLKALELQSENLKLSEIKLEASLRKTEADFRLEMSANTIKKYIPGLIDLLKMSEEIISLKLSQKNIDPIEIARIIEQQAELRFSINEAYYLFQLDIINQKSNQ
jgi:hypothetical protein